MAERAKAQPFEPDPVCPGVGKHYANNGSHTSLPVGGEVFLCEEKMRLIINGKEVNRPEGTTVAAVVEDSQLPTEGLIVAVGDAVVPQAEWAAALLHEGDTVDLLRFVSGG